WPRALRVQPVWSSPAICSTIWDWTAPWPLGGGAWYVVLPLRTNWPALSWIREPVNNGSGSDADALPRVTNHGPMVTGSARSLTVMESAHPVSNHLSVSTKSCGAQVYLVSG